MTYARIVNNAIDTVGRLPNSARRLDTGEWVMGLTTAPPELVATTGWFEVVDVARPADTATTTHDRSVELVDGTPTVVWTERPKTQAELDAEAVAVRQQSRQLNVEQAVATLRQWADQAAATTVTQGNAVSTLQAVVTRLGVFFDRFADLVENQYGEQP